jgi:hypothetical protein
MKDIEFKKYLEWNKVEIKEWNFYKQNNLLEKSYTSLIVNTFLDKVWITNIKEDFWDDYIEVFESYTKYEEEKEKFKIKLLNKLQEEFKFDINNIKNWICKFTD